MHARERAIADLAGCQDNRVTRDQLLATGLGRGAIAHRLSTGRWQRVHPGVFLVAPAPLDPRARARAKRTQSSATRPPPGSGTSSPTTKRST